MPGSHRTQVDSAPAAKQPLNGREALNNPVRRASRVVYVPRQPVPEPPDSTRIMLLDTGRIGVIFATGPDGRRRQRAVDTLGEAEDLVRVHRAGGSR